MLPLYFGFHPFPDARLAAGLFEKIEILDFDAFIEGFGHVVDGEGGDAGGREGFHFDAGLAGGDGKGRDADAGGFDDEFNVDVREGEGVAHRNELAGFLGGEDAGNAGDFEGIALGVGLEFVDYLTAHFDEGVGAGGALGDGFGGDIDHAGLAGGIVVGEFAHVRGSTWISSPGR